MEEIIPSYQAIVDAKRFAKEHGAPVWTRDSLKCPDFERWQKLFPRNFND